MSPPDASDTLNRSLSSSAKSDLIAAPRISLTVASKNIETVDASELPYEAFLHDYLRAGRPVVVRNAATRWPALSKWRPDYFKSKFGKQPVSVAYDKTMPFDQFIDEVLASSEDSPGPYMFRLFLHEQLPELLSDLIPQNAYAYPRRYGSPLMPESVRRPDGYLKLLIGGSGSKFPMMHYDGENAHAAITEIYGDKEIILFSPEDTPFIYARADATNVSKVENPHCPDLNRFPLMAKATPYRAVIEPGQMVFIPARWWHTARPLTPSVSVCTNILDQSNWSGFVEELSKAPVNHPVKKIFKRVYLSGLGGLLTAMEQLQEKSPALSKLLILPEVLSPISAAVAREPSASPLKIRIPAG